MPRHQDNDIPIPADIENDAADGGVSQLDQEPDTQQPKRKPGVRVRQTKKGSVQVDFQEQPEAQVADPEPEIQSMVDVESARPSLPKQLRGVLTVYRTAVNHKVCEDGVTEAINGWCGEINDAPGFQGEILKAWGGGKYEAKGIDKRGKEKAIVVPLGGYSKPIPGTPEGYPNGSAPNDQGGFSRGPAEPWINSGYVPADFGLGGVSVQEDEPLVDEDGYFRQQAVVQQGLQGWVWDYGRNNHKWMGPGNPNGPPPPPPGMGVQPTLYDHSEPKADPELKELLKALVASSPKQDDERRREEARERREEEQRRRDEEKDERRRDEEKRREEAKERREEENKRRDEEREQRRRDEERAREDRKEAAKLAESSARAQADAVKEAARLASEAQKESAKLQADSQKHLFDILLRKSDEGSSVEKTIGIATQIASMVGGGGKSESAETIEAVTTGVQNAMPALTQAGVQIAAAYRGGSPPPGGASPAGPNAEQQQTVAALQLTGYLVESWRRGMKPSVARLEAGCIAYGLYDRYKDVASQIVQATPELVSMQFKAGVASLGNPPQFVAQVQFVDTMVGDQGGRAWFSALQQAIRASQAPIAPVVAPAIAPPAPAAVPPPANGGVDPTRPEIKMS